MNYTEYGFQEREGHLAITCPNSTRDNRAYWLKVPEDHRFSDIQVDLTVDSTAGSFAALGIGFYLNGLPGKWFLWYGDDGRIDQGRLILEVDRPEGKMPVEKTVFYPLGTRMRLGISWDATAIHLTANGREKWSEPDSTQGSTFNITCNMGPNTTDSPYMLTGSIDLVSAKPR